MGQNVAINFSQILNDVLFSKDEIESSIAKREHIFELRRDGQSLGYISLYDLKDYLSLNQSSSEAFSIRNIDQQEFQMLYEHPLFQRRRPQIIEPAPEEIAAPEEQQYHILQHGQKSGPYSKKQIEKFLSNKEMIMNDMISLNGGQSWQKVYTTPGFDRRELKQVTALPRLPDEDFLKQGPADFRRLDEVTEATSSLAYLGNLKKGKVVNHDLSHAEETEVPNKKITVSSYKWLFVISLIGIGYFLYNIKSALQSPLGDLPAQPVLGEHAEMLRPTDSDVHLNASPRRSEKFQTRQMNPIRPRPRTTQKSFREANPGVIPQHDMNPDPNYYYDNSAPMELDPVREQVSKETFEGVSPGDPGQETGAPGDTPPPPADDALFNQASSN